MSNKTIFKSLVGIFTPKSDIINEVGGTAYKLSPKLALICIDIQPYAHTQAQERADILNVGGFSDQVFNLVTEFANGNLTAEHWVGVIEKVEL